MNIIENITNELSEEMYHKRDLEFRKFLAIYNLKPENLKQKGYEVVYEFDSDTRVETWKLCKVINSSKYKFTYNVTKTS